MSLKQSRLSIVAAVLGLLAFSMAVPASRPMSAAATRESDAAGQQCSVEAEGSLTGKRAFALEAELEEGKLEGKLKFRDKAANLEFESTAITKLAVSGKVASVQGLGKTKSGSPLRFSASLDAGRKTFTLRLSNGYSAQGAFTGDDDDGDEVELKGHCPFDGEASILLDAPRGVNATIGRAGGSLTAGGVTLTIPAGALSGDRLIRMTPISGLAGTPLSLSPIVGVQLEPSGLVLLKPASLTLPRPTAVAAAQIAGFGYNGTGQGLRLVPHQLAAGAVRLLVWHFSGAGVVSAPLAELEAVLGYVPTARHEQAEQLIAAALADTAVPYAVTQQRIELVLAAWYNSSVRLGLDVATTGPIGFFELAFGEWQAWLAYTGLYITNPLPASLAGQQGQASALALIGARAQANLLLDDCKSTNTNVLVTLRNVIRLANVVTLASIPIQGLGLPAGDDLATSCMRVEIDSLGHAVALARDLDNRFSVQASVVFYTGPASNSIPLHYRLEDATNGFPLPVASETTSTGGWLTAIRPTTLVARRYDVIVELDAAATDDVLQALSARRSVTLNVRERLDLRARRASDPTAAFTDAIGPVAAGGTVDLEAGLVGDDLGGVVITLSHTGAGVLPATVTTGVSGAARFTYTAPAGAASELVTATVTDNGIPRGDAIVIDTRVPVTVAVSPPAVSLTPGQTMQFTATVTGTSNTAVTWSATGGAITASGLYTAGNVSGNFSVRATSAADTTVSDTAMVSIINASVYGTWTGTVNRLESGPQPVRVQMVRPLPGATNPFQGTTGAADDVIAVWTPDHCLQPLFGTLSRMARIGPGVFSGPWTRWCGFPAADLPFATVVTAELGGGVLILRWHGTLDSEGPAGTPISTPVVYYEFILTDRVN